MKPMENGLDDKTVTDLISVKYMKYTELLQRHVFSLVKKKITNLKKSLKIISANWRIFLILLKINKLKKGSFLTVTLSILNKNKWHKKNIDEIFGLRSAKV